MQSLLLAHRERIVELCRTHHVRRFSVFGSAVRDDFDPATSDVDVRVEFDDTASLKERDSFGLHDGLIELFGRKVDLLSTPKIETPYLRRIIESSQVTLYAA